MAIGQPDELDELIDFLVDKRPGIRGQAAELILGLTGSPEGLDRLKAKTNKLLVFTLRLLGETDEGVSKTVLSALVNMAHDKDLSQALVKQNVVNRCMDYLKERTCKHPRLLIMLLNNLTACSEDACNQLMQLGQEKLQGLNLAILLQRFVMSGVAYTGEGDEEDPYEHVASILTNVSRLKEARVLLLQPGRGTLQALVAQLQAPGVTRRQGVAGTLRNCCMTAEEDGTLDHILSDTLVLTRMLGPISGQEPKETDDHVRTCLAESVMVLASCDKGLQALLAAGAEDLLHKGYEFETNPEVCHAMERTAEYFLIAKGQKEDEPETQQEQGSDAKQAQSGKQEGQGSSEVAEGAREV